MKITDSQLIPEKPIFPLNWQSIMQEWETSGLRQREFCKARSLVYSQFMYHRGQLKKSESKPAELLPIQLVAEKQSIPTPTTATPFVLQWPSGLRLSIPIGADSATLKTLLSYLERP